VAKRPPFLDAAIAELRRLGVDGKAVFVDRQHIGVEVGETRFTTTPLILGKEDSALDWAAIVAALAREVRA
jgi:hypothetical protein